MYLVLELTYQFLFKKRHNSRIIVYKSFSFLFFCCCIFSINCRCVFLTELLGIKVPHFQSQDSLKGEILDYEQLVSYLMQLFEQPQSEKNCSLFYFILMS